MDDLKEIGWKQLTDCFRDAKGSPISADWVDRQWRLTRSRNLEVFRYFASLAARRTGYAGDDGVDYWLDLLREKAKKGGHFRELCAAVKVRGRKRKSAMGTIDNVWQASAEYCARHVGRPRKDMDRAKVIELRSQGKKLREIKNQMDQETGEHRSEDAYRKLVASRKAKTR